MPTTPSNPKECKDASHDQSNYGDHTTDDGTDISAKYGHREYQYCCNGRSTYCDTGDELAGADVDVAVPIAVAVVVVLATSDSLTYA
jgi:hypothetical protein